MKAILLLMLALAPTLLRAEPCPDVTRPHATRCDQYFRCVLLPSQTHVWVPTQCEKGLIYEPQLKTCVLPGDDWECNLSAEVGNESGENIYGINNLPAAFYTGPTPNPVKASTVAMVPEVRSTEAALDEAVVYAEPEAVTEEQPVEKKQQAVGSLPTISGDNEGYYIVLDRDGNNRTTFYHTTAAYQDDDVEYSGDGQITEPDLPIGEQKHSTTKTTASIESDNLTTQDLNSFLADYTLKTTSELPVEIKKKKHPLPADGKIRPEHMTVILHQQKKLNRYASKIKQKGDPTGGVGDKSPFTDQPVFTSRPEGSVLFNVPQRIPEESYVKSPFMSEDVIRSIIEISQQMMTHQKPQPEQMYVKPIFIPISVSSTTQDFSRLPEKPNKIMYHQLFPSLSNNSSQFSSKPIGITITNPYTLGQATIYDNLRDQIMTDSQFNTYKTSMVDAYGNRFQPHPISNVPPQMYPYPPQMAYPTFSQPTFQYPPAAYYDPPQVMNRLRNTLAYGHHDDSSSNESNIVQEEEDIPSNEQPEKQISAALNLQSSAEDDDEDTNEIPSTKKLIAVGGATLDYNNYKDSILPLLNANPNDVHISVLTCTLGSRQPNKTDCTKYYVCNPQNGAFQSFTCPSFTAFDADARICTTDAYKSCQKQKQHPIPTSQPTLLSRLAQHQIQSKLASETNQLKKDLITAHKYVDLIKQEAVKILSRNKVRTESTSNEDNETDDDDGDNASDNNMIRIESPTVPTSISPSTSTSSLPPAPSTASTTTTTSTTTTQTAATSTKRTKPKRKHGSKKRTGVKTKNASSTTTTTTEAPAPKAPRCSKNGKMADPAVQKNYYVCYKASPKKFIKTRMACPNQLIYCASREVCTLSSNCKQ